MSPKGKRAGWGLTQPGHSILFSSPAPAAPWPRPWGAGVGPHTLWHTRAGGAGLRTCCRSLLCSQLMTAWSPAVLPLQTHCLALLSSSQLGSAGAAACWGTAGDRGLMP